MNELTVEKKWTVGRCQEVVFRPCRPKANAARCVGVVLQSARKADGARVVCAMLSGTVWSSRINCGRNPSTMTDAVVAWFRRWTPTPTWCRVQRTRASTRVLRHRLLRPIASDPTNGVVLGADQRRGLRWCCSFAGHRRYQLQTIQKSSFFPPTPHSILFFPFLQTLLQTKFSPFPILRLCCDFQVRNFVLGTFGSYLKWKMK